jgi:PTS system fructose-specific IIC component
MSLITQEQVVLDLSAPDRHEATTLLAQRLVESGRCTDIEVFLADVRAREAKMATGLPGGIGIPHARSAAITEPSLVFGRAVDGIDWGAKDGPAALVFLIAAPEGGGDAHMQMLPKLARALMKKDFKAALMAATTPAEVVDIVNAEVVDPAPATAAAASAGPAALAPRVVPWLQRPPAWQRATDRGCSPSVDVWHGRAAWSHPRRRDLLPDRHCPHLHGC